MWKILLAFVAFAAAAIFVLTRSGADVDMGGEKHDVGAGHSVSATTNDAASAPASAASK